MLKLRFNVFTREPLKLFLQSSLIPVENCCDMGQNMGQNDTISKIELNPSFVLSSDETHYKNDIQLFHQLFDELCVNRDYH